MLAKVFEGRPVRFLPTEDEVLVPLPDIARALDYDGKVLRNLIDRNEELFEQGKVVTTLPSEGGPQETTCLNRDGVVGLLMKLSTSRIKDPAKRNLIVAFQRWAVKTIREVAQGVYRAREAPEVTEMARLIESFRELQGGFLQTLRVFSDIMKRYDNVRPAGRPAKVIQLDGARSTRPAGLDPARVKEMNLAGREMLTTQEVAALFGITTRAVVKRIRQGKLKAELVVSGRRGGRGGRTWVIPAREIFCGD